MKLQIAIDSMTDDEALKFIQSVEQYSDIIEIGTPLIYKYGLKFVSKVNEKISTAQLLADAKIVDAGALESRMFLENGADIITVLGGASNTTIKEARTIVQDYRAKLMIDLIDTPSRKKVNRVKELHKFGCDYFCIHRPSDTKTEENLFLPDFSSISSELYLAAAGGINGENIRKVISYNPEVIIIGSAITEATDPMIQAKKFSQIIKNRD